MESPRVSGGCKMKHLNKQALAWRKKMNAKINAEEKRAYFKGYADSTDDFAIWRNGKQLVGCIERPKETVLFNKWKELFPKCDCTVPLMDECPGCTCD